MTEQVSISLIPRQEFERVRVADGDRHARLSLIADMCRYNTLAAVKHAGSGHLGTSFSAMDLVVWLYYEVLNSLRVGLDNPDRDIYFSSKGHDVPGLYSVLYSLGVVSRAQILKLRRYGGLDGHPNVMVPGIEANTGSLGMGISKARGIAWAKNRLGYGGRVFVMTGDGELQEGQNYEALRSAVHQGITNLTVIVDHNKVQSDRLVGDIMDVGDIRGMFESFGWHAVRCDGHDMKQIDQTLADLETVRDRPRAIVADTIKGRGVSFMEHPAALKDGAGYYHWHAGAPDDRSFAAAEAELRTRIMAQFAAMKLAHPRFDPAENEDVTALSAVPAGGDDGNPRGALGEPRSQGATVKAQASSSAEYVVEAFGSALVEIAATRPDVVVLDADLAADCRVRAFELAFPDRFIQNGIAEQDMVSMAGGLARHGLLPVVNSFATFLAARANEQIYNNATENSRIVYVCHYAGLIPAGPGMSHQSLRDISLLGALPNVTMLQPSNALETRMALDYCINRAPMSCVLRLAIGPSPRAIELPPEYQFVPGRGVALATGTDGVLMAYGPVMLHEALLAAEALGARGYHLTVVNMPWLNRFDDEWLHQIVTPHESVFVLEDHSSVGGLGDRILKRLTELNLIHGRLFEVFGVDGYPACGAPAEVLRHHRLDGLSLAEHIDRGVTTTASMVASGRSR